MDHATEMERIEASEKAAQEYIDKLPREQVDALGESNLLMDLTHEFLLKMPSGSIWEKSC
jgi:hypothetical protein